MKSKQQPNSVFISPLTVRECQAALLLLDQRALLRWQFETRVFPIDETIWKFRVYYNDISIRLNATGNLAPQPDGSTIVIVWIKTRDSDLPRSDWWLLVTMRIVSLLISALMVGLIGGVVVGLFALLLAALAFSLSHLYRTAQKKWLTQVIESTLHFAEGKPLNDPSIYFEKFAP